MKFADCYQPVCVNMNICVRCVYLFDIVFLDRHIFDMLCMCVYCVCVCSIFCVKALCVMCGCVCACMSVCLYVCVCAGEETSVGDYWLVLTLSKGGDRSTGTSWCGLLSGGWMLPPDTLFPFYTLWEMKGWHHRCVCECVCMCACVRVRVCVCLYVWLEWLEW